MGTCFECRATIDGVEHRRSCLDSGAAHGKLENDRFDIAVIGGGPAGIAAAVRASEAGERVVVLDSGARAGGQIWRGGSRAPLPAAAAKWLDALERSGAAVVTGADVLAISPGFRIAVQRGSEAVALAAERVVLASGARERFLPFPGWTLPNVFGIGGAQALAKSGASFRGKRVVLAGSGPLAAPRRRPRFRRAARTSSSWPNRPPPRGSRCSPRASGGRRASGPRRRATAALSPRRGMRREPGPSRRGEKTRICGGPPHERPPAGRRRATCSAPGTVSFRTRRCRAPDRLREWTGEAVTVDAKQETSVPNIFCRGRADGGRRRRTRDPRRRDRRRLRRRRGAAPGRAPRVPARLRELLREARPRLRLRRESARWPPPKRSCAGARTCASARLDPAWSPRQAKLYTRAGMGPARGGCAAPALAFHFGWGPDRCDSPTSPLRSGR